MNASDLLRKIYILQWESVKILLFFTINSNKTTPLWQPPVTLSWLGIVRFWKSKLPNALFAPISFLVQEISIYVENGKNEVNEDSDEALNFVHDCRFNLASNKRETTFFFVISAHRQRINWSISLGCLIIATLPKCNWLSRYPSAFHCVFVCVSVISSSHELWMDWHQTKPRQLHWYELWPCPALKHCIVWSIICSLERSKNVEWRSVAFPLLVVCSQCACCAHETLWSEWRERKELKWK